MFWSKRGKKKATSEEVAFRLEVVQGDITEQDVDVIVNAANSSLRGGGGVDGAIHKAAGPILDAECRHLRSTTLVDGLPTGQAVATGAGDLPSRWVVHTVGPNYTRGEQDPELLAACYRNSLKVADELGATSVAFPAVSAGIYGWPLEDAARIAVSTVQAVAPTLKSVRLVRFVLFTDEIAEVFRQVG